MAINEDQQQAQERLAEFVRELGLLKQRYPDVEILGTARSVRVHRSEQLQACNEHTQSEKNS